MKVAVLYFEGCPNHAPTVERVRRLVSTHNLDSEVEELEVVGPDDVRRLRFLGSPTVQVDDLDVEPSARTRTDFAMSCRLYNTPDGLPSIEMLSAALGINRARDVTDFTLSDATAGADSCCRSNAPVPAADRRRFRLNRRMTSVATVGSITTAAVSSACCWVPLLLLAFGASAAGVSSFFAAWRPVFITFAVVLLSVSAYFTFIRKSPSTADCCAGAPAGTGRWRRAAWFVSAAIVAALVLFPQYVSGLVADQGKTSARQDFGIEVRLAIEGMHCDACATSLAAALSRVDGVTHADVDYTTRTARVHVLDRAVMPRVEEEVRHLGFTAAIEGNSP